MVASIVRSRREDNMKYNGTMLRGIGGSILHNVARSYANGYWMWHVVAAVLTAALVFSGADWWFFTATRSEMFVPLIFAAGIGGFFMPILVPLVLYVWGSVRANEHMVRAGFAAAQAVIIAWCISSFYKAFTGRIEPEFLTHVLDDRSRTFNFGFLEYGIFWGWPSSHTAVAFALAAALTVYMRGARTVRLASFAYAVFIGIGAAIGFHWLSDVLAGAIVGVVVGIIVGRSFRA